MSNVDENHIDPITIKRLLADGIKVHSSATGRVGDVKDVANNGAITIYGKARGEHFVTFFDRGDLVELKQRSEKEFWIVNITRAVPQIDLFTNETDADRLFREFDERNPAVYTELVRLARELRTAGHKKIGIQMLIEVIRWKSMLKTAGDDFKINNNYAGRYARKIMTENNDLDGLFEIRGLRS